MAQRDEGLQLRKPGSTSRDGWSHSRGFLMSQESHLDKGPSSEKENNRTPLRASWLDPAWPLPSALLPLSFLWGTARVSGSLTTRLAPKYPTVRTKVTEENGQLDSTLHTHINTLTPTHSHLHLFTHIY